MARAFVDTNVVAYMFDSASTSKQASARAALASRGGLIVSTQVLLELYNVLTRKLTPAYSPDEARAIVERVADYGVVSADRALVERAMATASEHQLSIWDAMMVEAAHQAGCDELWTEDLADGSVLRGVRIVNPLLASS
ncbi:PIN domain-containing protein [Salana multivorans]